MIPEVLVTDVNEATQRQRMVKCDAIYLSMLLTDINHFGFNIFELSINETHRERQVYQRIKCRQGRKTLELKDSCGH